MMFRIAPASLAVLAIFNVASTLADDNFHVDFTVKPLSGLTIAYPTRIYHGSGCGNGNDLCSCTVPVAGPNAGYLIMHGVGTAGLSFECDFYVTDDLQRSQTKCYINVDLPYTDASNSLSCTCDDTYSYTFRGCSISSDGHRKNNVITVAWNDALDDQGSGMADSPTTCEADLAQCNVDKSLNAASVLSKLGEGTIKVVFD